MLSVYRFPWTLLRTLPLTPVCRWQELCLSPSVSHDRTFQPEYGLSRPRPGPDPVSPGSTGGAAGPSRGDVFASPRRNCYPDLGSSPATGENASCG